MTGRNSEHAYYEWAIAGAHKAVWRVLKAAQELDYEGEAEDCRSMLLSLQALQEDALKGRRRRSPRHPSRLTDQDVLG